jgi:hypothetical protein
MAAGIDAEGVDCGQSWGLDAHGRLHFGTFTTNFSRVLTAGLAPRR